MSKRSITKRRHREDALYVLSVKERVIAGQYAGKLRRGEIKVEDIPFPMRTLFEKPVEEHVHDESCNHEEIISPLPEEHVHGEHCDHE